MRFFWLSRRAACALVAALLLALATASCEFICWSWDGQDCEPEAFRIRIDTLGFAPAQPSAGDTLRLLLWGTVGHNTCYGFTHFSTTRDSFQIDVIAWGEHSCGQACGEAMVYLRGEELPVFPVYEGDLLVVVHQPGGAVLVDTVAVGPERPGSGI